MKKNNYFLKNILFVVLLACTLINPPLASAQVTNSNPWCTKVGTTDAKNPCEGLTGTCNLPIPPEPQLKQALKDQIGLDMIGAWDNKHLQWTFEDFCKFRGTKFAELIKGEPITLIVCVGRAIVPNQETGRVQMCQNGSYDTDRAYYTTTLTHELGHIIYHNRKDPDSLKSRYDNLFTIVKVPFTNYASSYSGERERLTENYAEMIAYCLNGRAVGSTIDQALWSGHYGPLTKEIIGNCIKL